MQSALVLPGQGVPRAKLIASSQRKFLAIAHHDGSISMFSDFEQLCSILNPHQSVCFMRIVRDSLLVGFSSGVFAKFNVYTGGLKVSVKLDFEVRDCLMVDSSILLIGDDPQMVVVHRKTLEIEHAIPLPAVSVHATKYGNLAIIYCDGEIDYIDDETWELSRGFSLPSKAGKSGVEEPIVGASVLPNGQWVIIRRHIWTLYEKEGEKLVSQFESAAVSPFNYCVPDAEGILVVCDDERVILIENNNVQIIDPVWPRCTLVGVAFLGVGRCAVLRDLSYYVLDNSGQWKGPQTFTPITDQKWTTSEGYMSDSKLIKSIETQETVCELAAQISCLHISKPTGYAGLANGSLAVLETSDSSWKVSKVTRLLNSPIIGIQVCEGWVVAWSTDTVGALLLTVEDKFHVIPIGRQVKYAYTSGDHLRVVHGLGHQEWDLVEGTIISGGEPEVMWPQSFTTWKPITVAPFDDSKDTFGVIYTLDKGISAAIMPTKPTAQNAPLIYTVKAYQGESIAESVEGLRAHTTIGIYEDFVVHISSIDPSMGRLAASILTAMWSPMRLNELQNSAGTRALVLLNTIYPLVPVGDWLRKQLGALFEGSRKDKLLGLQLLAKHPDLDLCSFPFKAIEETRDTCTAETFISEVAKADIRLFNDIMTVAARQQDLVPTILYCINTILEHDVLRLKGDELASLVATITSSLSAGKLARDLLANLYWRYPKDVLFNRRKQKILVVLNSPPTFATVFDLRRGTNVDLTAPEGGIMAVEFVNDGDAVEGSSSTQTYSWDLSRSVFSIFKRQLHTIDPQNISATMDTKAL